MIYLEWCSKPELRNGLFLPSGEVQSKTGFRSVYGFPIKPVSSKGLKEHEVFSDVLFLDFDDGETGNCVRACSLLDSHQIGYDMFTSGSKGVHFHIPIQAMQGKSVPFSQFQFVKGLDLGADLSLYRASSLIRLEGTVHAKTGKKKTKIKTVSGSRLEIDLVEPPTKFVQMLVPETDAYETAFVKYITNMYSTPAEGTRTNTLWFLARSFNECGLSFDTGLELLQKLNESWSNPKDDESVFRATKDGYK